MRAQLYRWLVPIGLAAATLACTVTTASARPPVVRDHRGPVADRGPRQAPPPPRAERPGAARRGFVWVQGHWDWRNGRWEWIGGHWEREQRGKRWNPVRWEQRGGVWVRVDGRWDVGGDDDDRRYPREAPPSPREERQAARAGFVWIRGHHEWRDGQYQWVPGHWERERANQRWVDGRWELRNGRWEWNAGYWETGAPRPPVAVYPTQPPPALREEREAPRAGFVWVRGHYEWRNGQYDWVPGHWERERARERWVDGRWELRGDRWEWVPGFWENRPAQPAADTRGWTMLREHTFYPRARDDYRQFDVSQKQGRFNRIMLQVVDNDAELDNVEIIFVSGQRITPKIRERFRAGSATRAIDLPANQILRAIRLNARPMAGRARVILWGWAVQPAAPPPHSHNPPPPPSGGYTPPPPSSGPTSPPPAPRQESYQPRAGFVWIRGHYEWRNGQYEWIPGHWERERARQTWVDAKWELRGNTWVLIPGHWR